MAISEFENWNRYYYPGGGSYLQIDPMHSFEPLAARHNAYAYAGNNPIAFIDPDGLFKQPGNCPNWKIAIEAARRQAGCGAGAGGGTKDSCRCQEKLRQCKACDICHFLSDAYLTPVYRVKDLKCADKKAWGCSNVYERKDGSYKPGYVDVDAKLCEDPALAGKLAGTLLHEASHFCKTVPGGGNITDKPGECSAKAIADECSK